MTTGHLSLYSTTRIGSGPDSPMTSLLGFTLMTESIPDCRDMVPSWGVCGSEGEYGELTGSHDVASCGEPGDLGESDT